MSDNYLSLNKKLWDARTAVHYDSEFYDVTGFLNGKSSLNEIELNLLGDIKGKSILHLQCHFGQDTIELSRLGAEATGIDLSSVAIQKARQLAQQAGTATNFMCSDVYDLPNQLDEKFDIVFTSYGVLGWLPDMNKWAAVVHHFLKKGGRLVLAEFHPIVWMFDEDFSKIAYRYANGDPIVEIEEGTYTDRDANISLESVSWNHGLGDVINALINNGLTIKALHEYDYSPYDCFNKTTKIAERKYRIEHLGDKIPMVYAIVGER